MEMARKQFYQNLALVLGLAAVLNGGTVLAGDTQAKSRLDPVAPTVPSKIEISYKVAPGTTSAPITVPVSNVPVQMLGSRAIFTELPEW
jgi:hypothetical protein